MNSNAHKSPRTIIAFDYGTQKIGVAVGQELTKTANPLAPLKAKDGIPNWDTIGRLVAEWQPDLFVVGHPLNMDGSDNEVTVRARKFARRLTGRFNKVAELMDERLSTFDAKELVKSNEAMNTKSGRRNFSTNPVDSIAAALILESWFRAQPA